MHAQEGIASHDLTGKLVVVIIQCQDRGVVELALCCRLLPSMASLSPIEWLEYITNIIAP